jgi:carotenoid 1,2-hydratase
MNGERRSAGVAHQGPVALSGGGHPDGGTLGAPGSLVRVGGPRFDLSVAPGGYGWWCVDGLSQDGRRGISVVASIGNFFSPYYAWARRTGRPDPRDHCTLNVALYGDGARRWAMTERNRTSLHQTQESLAIGPSSLDWDGETLTIRIDETCAPIPTRVRGKVRVRSAAIATRDFALDSTGHHRWWPIAPSARIEVDLERPAVRWTGNGYLDMNSGCEPLEQGFGSWDWTRATLLDRTAILYDTRARQGQGKGLALRIDAHGEIEEFEGPPRAGLPDSRIWRIERGTRCEPGHSPRIARTLEDTPFYARSLVQTRLLGREVTAMHQSLCLDRFASPWIQTILPFRIPRAGRG